MTANKWESDIATMMVGFGQPVRTRPDSALFQPPSEKEILLRYSLIDEEVNKELLPAMERGDLEKIADGIVDSIVVLIGAAHTYGITLGPIWEEVLKTNMAKIGGPKDPVTGKTMKPEGWEPPRIKEILIDQGWDSQWPKS